MKKQLEIITIKANSASFNGCALYWIFSRTQLEFVLKEVEIVSLRPFVSAAKYQDDTLPVVNLEKYYGLEENRKNGPAKYFVIRSVNEQKELVKLIVETPQSLKIHKLETNFKSLQSLVLPQNSAAVLGMYPLGSGKVGVVPDFVAMTRSLGQRENQERYAAN